MPTKTAITLGSEVDRVEPLIIWQLWISTCIFARVGSGLPVYKGDGEVRDPSQQTAFLLPGLKTLSLNLLRIALTQKKKTCQGPHNSVCVLVTQSCLSLCDPMDCSLPGSSAHEFPRQEY